ncbi:helix-turn-helix domain-containing protein [Bacillus sp. FJAT-45350]|uniref:helix-turn-helix domain-containing protein n=1 Tax=Bacillus sp. FJAT-45350 TaxID=2011014 RepID=UPI000BB98CE5|nr:helix-turn-helix domain-containing protein [Bacillus sp. FJAT-45350]
MYGERIRTLRKERNMTLRDLAEKLKIPFTTLGNYEREDREPNVSTFLALADFFEVSVDYLTGKQDSKTSDRYYSERDFNLLENQLKQTTPDIRQKAEDIINQMTIIIGDDLEAQDVRETTKTFEHLFQVVNFIFSMKMGFKYNYGQDPSTPYECIKLYLDHKPTLDKNLNALCEIYANKKI